MPIEAYKTSCWLQIYQEIKLICTLHKCSQIYPFLCAPLLSIHRLIKGGGSQQTCQMYLVEINHPLPGLNVDPWFKNRSSTKLRLILICSGWTLIVKVVLNLTKVITPLKRYSYIFQIWKILNNRVVRCKLRFYWKYLIIALIYFVIFK